MENTDWAYKQIWLKVCKSTERSEVISKSDQIHLENKDKHS